MDKPVLDATCGSRMIWFNKNNELAVFVDKRELDNEAIWTSGDGKVTRYCNIHPDIIADFTCLPFEDNTFYHVVFDPPHLIQGGDKQTWFEWSFETMLLECLHQELKKNSGIWDIEVSKAVRSVEMS